MNRRVHIRWASRRDIAACWAIEQHVGRSPRPIDEIEELTRTDRVHVMVAEVGPVVVGWMVYGFHANWIELLTLAVHPQYRRMGVGRQLAGKMTEKLDAQHLRVCLIARETNLAGQQFLRAAGFLADRVYRRHFADTREDAYRFTFSAVVPAMAGRGPSEREAS